jgi:hypothetical protein
VLFYRKEDASKLKNLVTFGGKKGGKGKVNKDKQKIEQMQHYCEEQVRQALAPLVRWLLTR